MPLYLQGLRQFVNIDGEVSETKKIKLGVPQGSILGPILFLLHINSIAKIGLKKKVYLYADDVALWNKL